MVEDGCYGSCLIKIYPTGLMNFLYYYLDKEKRQLEYSNLTEPKKSVGCSYNFAYIRTLMHKPNWSN